MRYRIILKTKETEKNLPYSIQKINEHDADVLIRYQQEKANGSR